MYARRIAVIVVPFMLLALFFVNQPAKATAWDTLSYCPSSVNDVWSEAGVNITDLPNSWAARELWPGFFVDLTSSTYKYISLATNNWTWAHWNGWDDSTNWENNTPIGGWPWYVGTSPNNIDDTLGLPASLSNTTHSPNWILPGDTIVSVQAVAYFISFHSPSFYWSISSNGGASWPIQSSSQGALYDGNPKMFAWNVTALRVWDPLDFSDSDLWLRITMEIYPGTFYALDYVGWVIEYVAGPGHYDSGGYELGDVWLDISGSFGVIGFIGMTISPAYAVMQWRQGGEGRLVKLIMALAAMVVFFALFLASINA